MNFSKESKLVPFSDDDSVGQAIVNLTNTSSFNEAIFVCIVKMLIKKENYREAKSLLKAYQLSNGLTPQVSMLKRKINRTIKNLDKKV